MTRAGSTAAVVAVAALLLTMTGPARAAEPASADRAVTAPTARAAQLEVTKGLLVLGDSIAYRSRHAVHRRHPRWRIDAVPGRPVSALPGLVDDVVDRGRVPRNLVIALGSNARWWWRKHHYAAAVDRLPSRVSVTLMTTYRSPRHWGGHPNWAKRPRVQKRYSRWMRQIADTRSNVCIMPWRRLARQRPGLLVDGVHPNARGQVRWAKLLAHSTRACRHSS